MSVERLLAAARFATGLGVFAATASNQGLFHSPAAKLASGGYALYAAGLAWAAWFRPERLWRGASTLHLADLASATAVVSASGGTSGHAVPLFAFVLMAAAYRWGLGRTLIDGALILAVVASERLEELAGLAPWGFEVDWFVVWSSYIVVLAALLAALSERHHAVSFQGLALGHVMAQLTQAPDPASAVSRALAETLLVFEARHALLVIETPRRNGVVLWQAERGPDGRPVTSRTEPGPDEWRPWVFQVPREVTAFEARRARAGGRPPVWQAENGSGRLVRASFSIPRAFAAPLPWDTLAAAVERTRNLRTTVYLLDPRSGPGGVLRLGFLRRLAEQVGANLGDLHRVPRPRSRAEWRERARISRELHDVVIPSLAGIEMRLDVLRRAEAMSPAIGFTLADLREQLHGATRDVRELMEGLRPIGLTARDLPVRLRELAEHFARTARIDVVFEWRAADLGLAPDQCREVYLIVKEALVNVRRHSTASRAAVRVDMPPGRWSLVVEDNGGGLGFTGRLTHEQLEARGPRVIRERVEALHGSLTVESSTGTRLEMTFPRSPCG